MAFAASARGNGPRRSRYVVRHWNWRNHGATSDPLFVNAAAPRIRWAIVVPATNGSKTAMEPSGRTMSRSRGNCGCRGRHLVAVKGEAGVALAGDESETTRSRVTRALRALDRLLAVPILDRAWACGAPPDVHRSFEVNNRSSQARPPSQELQEATSQLPATWPARRSAAAACSPDPRRRIRRAARSVYPAWTTFLCASGSSR